MLNTNSYLPPLLSNSNEQNRTKAILFWVFNYYFALPLEAIIKIIPCPEITSPIREGLGLVEWDRQTITVIDLADKLQLKQLNDERAIEHFLILTQTTSAELCGFLIEQSPMLMDIPWDSIRSVPSSYRQVAELGVIKQMAILPASTIHSERKLSTIENPTDSKSTETLKIFLLGEWNKFS